jgi:hypothetical protein
MFGTTITLAAFVNAALLYRLLVRYQCICWNPAGCYFLRIAGECAEGMALAWGL